MASTAPHAHGGPGHPDPHDHPRGHPHAHGDGRLGRLRHALSPHSHDTADTVAATLEASDRGIRAVKTSLVMLGLTAVAQLAIVAVSGSVALLADTIHNFSDALTAVPLWIAFVLGRRAATRRYTYGLGRAEDLAGLFVIAMIALSAGVAGWQAVARLLHPEPMTHLTWVAVAGFVGFLGNEAVAVYRIREGRAIGSAALVADGHHARTDGLTSLAVMLSAAGAALGWQWADPVIGLVITVMILLVLRIAARDVFRRLLDGVEPELLDRGHAVLAQVDGVRAVGQLRMRWVGHGIHADARLEVDPSLTLAAADDLAHRAEQALVEQIARIDDAVVHACPAQPASLRPPAHKGVPRAAGR